MCYVKHKPVAASSGKGPDHCDQEGFAGKEVKFSLGIILLFISYLIGN
jgi:hypothetical protein